MKVQDFNTFYDEVIIKCIKDIEEYSKKLSPNKVCITKKKNIKKKIFSRYQQKRDYIKYNYMSNKTQISLDRHKVASCMVYSILKTNPLKVNMWVPNLPEKIVLANEYLAFFIALNIIEMYKLDDLREENIESDYNIIIPQTYHEEEELENTYESNLCKIWYYIKINNIENFDVLGYANVFFLLQKYTDIYMEKENIKQKIL